MMSSFKTLRQSTWSTPRTLTLRYHTSVCKQVCRWILRYEKSILVYKQIYFLHFGQKDTFLFGFMQAQKG